MSKLSPAFFVVALLVCGCEKPDSRARFMTDSLVIDDWSVITFSDGYDFVIEVIRVDAQGRSTVVSTHDLLSLDDGLGPTLLVRTKPDVHVVGRGADTFDFEIALESNQNTKVHTQGLNGSIYESDSSRIVWCMFLETEEKKLPVMGFPTLHEDIGVIERRVIEVGIAAIAIQVTVKSGT